MEEIKFLDENGTFTMEQAENYSGLYFPIAGEKGLKSAVTPNFGGDSKVNQNTFLLEPVSVDNLHNNRSGRNFWCHMEGVGNWSVTGASAEAECGKFTEKQDKSTLTAGFMWHNVTRESATYRLKASVTTFVPVEQNVEITMVEVTNTGQNERTLTPTAAFPIYGRSADNIRDHRHVTSLLHRIEVKSDGVYVKPTMSFDERGHQKNECTYFVTGMTDKGEKPVDFYPIVEDYIGEGGNFTHPLAVINDEKGIQAGTHMEGKEAMGGLHFASVTLAAGESKTYIVFMGIAVNDKELTKLTGIFTEYAQVQEALEDAKEYWQKKVNVKYDTGRAEKDNYLRWISFQPVLRRIYGCSFLPHHDYGRGGRGWRDLWQDCLSLLIMEPDEVRQMILDNFGGVRIDGTNATIIGANQGEFIADRNHIARVWMDHGFWPFLTIRFYMDQTGDVQILQEDNTYFKDALNERGHGNDARWKECYGIKQKSVTGEIYEGTILEHLLVEQLCAFYDVGAHNHILLRGADWNDALDMAGKKGESVAFTCAYAGSLKDLADSIRKLHAASDSETTEIMEEMRILLADSIELYEDVERKKSVLKDFLILGRHNITGKKIEVNLEELASNLEHKSQWMMEHIRKTEWIQMEEGQGWFNSYYDNQGKRVEGEFNNQIRMMLTGQVFAVMSGTATEEQMKQIINSTDQYLYDSAVGGYRLNTDFHEVKYDLGRMFGFAYGEKENGAVFSHMTIMYANALYQRGFVKEGYKALETLLDTAMKFDTSKIYPGIPEYFNGKGRGLYHYLTGAASWYMMTMITQVFGVRGTDGDLLFEPKLTTEQFNAEGNASLELVFAGKRLHITYHNPDRLDYGTYQVRSITCVGKEMTGEGVSIILSRDVIEKMDNSLQKIEVVLG